VKLKNLADGANSTPKQLEEILELLESLDKHATYIKRSAAISRITSRSAQRTERCPSTW
jgi:hypothetical protein